MKRYLMSSNSIMNLNDKKSLDFQSISIVQNNNLVFAQYCVFSKYLQFYIIQIKSLYNSNFIRVANMVQCASQCNGVRRGRQGNFGPMALKYFWPTWLQKYLCKIQSKIFCTHRTLCCVCWLVWLT